MAIQVIFGEIQEAGDIGLELRRGLELEGRQLQHVELGIRLLTQQGQRSGAKIAADRHVTAGTRGHLRDQRGHGGLGVRAGDRDQRGPLALRVAGLTLIQRTHEECDLADQPLADPIEYRLTRVDARTEHHLAEA